MRYVSNCNTPLISASFFFINFPNDHKEKKRKKKIRNFSLSLSNRNQPPKIEEDTFSLFLKKQTKIPRITKLQFILGWNILLFFFIL